MVIFSIGTQKLASDFFSRIILFLYLEDLTHSSSRLHHISLFPNIIQFVGGKWLNILCTVEVAIMIYMQ